MTSDTSNAISSALVNGLRRDCFPYEAVVVRATCPDDGGSHLELHVFDVPRNLRRALETELIELLLRLEDRLGPVGALAFVHRTELSDVARQALRTAGCASYAPTNWCDRASANVVCEGVVDAASATWCADIETCNGAWDLAGAAA